MGGRVPDRTQLGCFKIHFVLKKIIIYTFKEISKSQSVNIYWNDDNADNSFNLDELEPNKVDKIINVIDEKYDDIGNRENNADD